MNETKNSKFVTKNETLSISIKCKYYNVIIYNTEMLKSNLCDYSDSYFLVSGDITATTAPATQSII